jgi:hypothetical protein
MAVAVRPNAFVDLLTCQQAGLLIDQREGGGIARETIKIIFFQGYCPYF